MEIFLSTIFATNERIKVNIAYANRIKIKTSKGRAVCAATVLEVPIRSLTVIEKTTEDVKIKFMKLLVSGLKAILRETGRITYLKIWNEECPRA